MQSFLTRRTWLKGAGAALGVAVSPLTRARHLAGQASAPVVTRTDFVYGRVEGSALLANLAWPDGPGPRPAILSVHGGRWRAGNRTDASSIKVVPWAEFGFFAMSIDYRLVGGSPAPSSRRLNPRNSAHARTGRSSNGAQEVPQEPSRLCRRLRESPCTRLPRRGRARAY